MSPLANNPEACIGIDLGGTAIKAGRIFVGNGRRQRVQTETRVAEGPDNVIRRMADVARELGEADRLGVGVPGLVDHKRGVILQSPNLAPLEGFPLRAALASELGLDESQVQIENDGCAAAIGEHWLGAARGLSNLMMVTLGTGVGGGLILNGQPFRGSTGLAAEIGHVVVDPAGPLCGCGNSGCLEALASAGATQRRARERGIVGDAMEISRRARAGDAPASELLHDVGRDLGRGLASALMLLDLEAFLIGGGFGAALDLMGSGIEEGLLERSYGRARENLRILPAELGPDAGWIGAVRLASNPNQV